MRILSPVVFAIGPCDGENNRAGKRAHNDPFAPVSDIRSRKSPQKAGLSVRFGQVSRSPKCVADDTVSPNRSPEGIPW